MLSRFPLRLVKNHDISVAGHERRGCLHTDVDVAEADAVHVFNVHLGTAFLERRHQGRRLAERARSCSNRELKGPRIVLGDFNEWTRGLTTRLLRLAPQERGRAEATCGGARTFPGILPILHLDHIYYDDTLELKRPGCTAPARRWWPPTTCRWSRTSGWCRRDIPEARSRPGARNEVTVAERRLFLEQ